MEVRPGNRRIVHHVVMYVDRARRAGRARRKAASTCTSTRSASTATCSRDNTGRLLKKGTRLRFDMHYFAIGEEQTDQTDDGVHLLSEGLRAEVPKCGRSRSGTVPNDELEIPPNTVVRHDGYFRLHEAGPHRRVPAAHAHARQGDDARSDPSRTTRSRS